jgi:hypothetical protein
MELRMGIFDDQLDWCRFSRAPHVRRHIDEGSAGIAFPRAGRPVVRPVSWQDMSQAQAWKVSADFNRRRLLFRIGRWKVFWRGWRMDIARQNNQWLVGPLGAARFWGVAMQDWRGRLIDPWTGEA